MKLTHVRVLVEDFGASHRFYAEVLGLPTTWGFPRQEMDAAVALRPPGDAAVLVLEVEDADAAFQTAVDRGAQAAADPVDHPEWGIRTAHLRDPDGNLVELYQDIERVQE